MRGMLREKPHRKAHRARHRIEAAGHHRRQYVLGLAVRDRPVPNIHVCVQYAADEIVSGTCPPFDHDAVHVFDDGRLCVIALAGDRRAEALFGERKQNFPVSIREIDEMQKDRDGQLQAENRPGTRIRLQA